MSGGQRTQAERSGTDRVTRALRAALSVAGHVPATATWRPLVGGRTNRVWHVRARGVDLVCKLTLPKRDTPLFPNDPSAEIAVLRHLAGTGLAPDPVWSGPTPLGPCLLYRHLEGRVGTAGPEALRDVLDRVHRQPAPPGLRRLSLSAAAVLGTGDAMLARMGDPHGLAALRPPAIALTEARPTLLHGDPVPGNIVVGQGGAVLIDWQCPAFGDPLFDLAIALSPAMQTLERGAPLGPGARATVLADPEQAARFARAEPLFSWRMAVYCAWRIARGHAAYRPALVAELDRLQQRS